MGLDFVEFIMALESTLEIAVPDEQGDQWKTCGDAVDWLLQQREVTNTCSSQRAFHAARSRLLSSGVQRRRVELDSQVERSGQREQRLSVLSPVLSRRAERTVRRWCETTTIEALASRASWSRADLWLVVRLAAALQAGSPRSAIRRSTRFVDLFTCG